MGCASCGKKHPLSRSNQMARHYTNPAAKRRAVGRMPVPVPPLPVKEPELLPYPEVIEDQLPTEEPTNETT